MESSWMDGWSRGMGKWVRLDWPVWMEIGGVRMGGGPDEWGIWERE